MGMNTQRATLAALGYLGPIVIAVPSLTVGQYLHGELPAWMPLIMVIFGLAVTRSCRLDMLTKKGSRPCPDTKTRSARSSATSTLPAAQWAMSAQHNAAG